MKTRRVRLDSLRSRRKGGLGASGVQLSLRKKARRARSLRVSKRKGQRKPTMEVSRMSSEVERKTQEVENAMTPFHKRLVTEDMSVLKKTTAEKNLISACKSFIGLAGKVEALSAVTLKIRKRHEC